MAIKHQQQVFAREKTLVSRKALLNDPHGGAVQKISAGLDEAAGSPPPPSQGGNWPQLGENQVPNCKNTQNRQLCKKSIS